MTSPDASGHGMLTPEVTRVSGRRFVAHFVDGVFFSGLFVIAILAVGALPSGTAGDVVLGVVLVGGLTIGHVAYFVVLQKRRGRTPGKSIVGIRVVDAAGATPGTAALVKRSLPLLIEYLYLIAFISMMSSAYRQRLGDRWGDTYVVRDR
jgi:uncharacterized RDD family membrane protein YckC